MKFEIGDKKKVTFELDVKGMHVWEDDPRVLFVTGYVSAEVKDMDGGTEVHTFEVKDIPFSRFSK